MNVGTYFYYFVCFQMIQEVELPALNEMCNNNFLLQTEQLPTDKRFRASVANGYFGTIVYDSIFHLNGFYNGKETDSTFTKIPNLIAFSLNAMHLNAHRTYILDMFNGIFIEKISEEGYTIIVNLYAHQKLKSIMCADVEITRLSNKKDDISVKLQPLGLPLDKIDDMIVLDHTTNKSFTYLKVTSLVPEREDFPPPNVTIVSTNLPETLYLNSDENNKRWSFVLSVTVNNDELAWKNIKQALDLAKNGTLIQLHKDAWNKLWEEGGNIDILGNCNLAKIVNAAFYYITSSMPMGANADYIEQINRWPYFGICPTSLAQMDTENETYWGHLFWDQETWMLPPIQIFYPDVIKRILIESRFRNLDSAIGKAKSLGYDGAMFPWESAYTGYDTSPWLPAVLREVHISGDVALAMQQYLHYTKDKTFVLKDGGYNVFWQIAKFWESRLTFQKEYNAYGIIDAMGPDEHHDNVNNSAYLNVIAQLSLRLPYDVYNTYIKGAENASEYKEPDSKWLDIADHIYIPFDSVLKFHPEFEGYNTSEQIKQADVVLLGYPLMYNVSEEVRRNDLNFYETVTSPEGPAMTWGMHAIGWLEVDEPERAKVLFEKSFAYIRQPFNIWTENAHGFAGAINFVTGMGGFLQSILNGYFGIRVYSDRFEFKPYPIPHTTGYSIKHMKYLGNVFSASVYENYFSLYVESLNDSTTCQLKIYKTGVIVPFQSYENLSLGKYAVICT